MVLAASVLVPPAQALRIVNYNITNYPGNNFTQRDPRLRTILGPVAPDIVVVQEMTSQTGVNNFLASVLNTLEPGQWAAAAFTNGNDTDNALFYKPSKVTLVSQTNFYPDPVTNLRLVNVYVLQPVGYTGAAAELRIYSCHLKASQGFETDRFNEAVGIRNHMNAMPIGTHAILMGDFNIYTSTEPAYGHFLGSQADNDGRVRDPLNLPGNWNNNAAFAAIHTQCPCVATPPGGNCPTGFGFAGGGMDDRFDQFLPTYNLGDANGLELLASTYKAIGNDGLHFNNDLNDPPVIPEGQAYADALVFASDHLPLRVDIQLPAEVQAPAMVAFGTVITGATAQQSVSISNPAVAPADDLDYSLVASAGFTAPGGTFAIEPGAPALLHTVSMSTASAGPKAGTLTVASDAADAPSLQVPLGGNVLRHAVASLDAGSPLLESTVDFGDHPVGQFADQPTAVHNLGWDASQARLALASATISGGDGRFSIVGGFAPVLVAGTPQGYTLHFDDSNLSSPADTVITASITFQSGDEALPGAQQQPDLVVNLRAKVLVQPTDALAALPTVTRLLAPFPNPPQHAGTTFSFDLAQAGDVHLEVFDVAGRRVASLAATHYVRGRHAVHWDGRGDGGTRLGSGVYFVRFSGGAFADQTARVTLLR